MFDDSFVHTVEITIRQSHLIDMIARAEDGRRETEYFYMPARFAFDGHSIDDAGLRVRGNSYVGAPKKAFKLKFDKTSLYVGGGQYAAHPENDGRRFFGLRRLNLRGSVSEKSFLNEIVGYEMYRLLDYPAPRVSFARVVITEVGPGDAVVRARQFKGLYLVTDHIDKTFLSGYFPQESGNLYKAARAGATLENEGDLENVRSPRGENYYRLTTNEARSDWSNLERFTETIATDWPNIDQYLDFDPTARFFAANNVMGNWDDYIFIANNYYLYDDPGGRFEFIPWDIENSFDVGAVGESAWWGVPRFVSAPLLDGLSAHHFFDIGRPNRPLWDRLVTDPRFTAPYLAYCEQLTRALTALANQTRQWAALIHDAAIEPYHCTDATQPGRAHTTSPQRVCPPPCLSMHVDEATFTAEVDRLLDFLDRRRDFLERTYFGPP